MCILSNPSITQKFYKIILNSNNFCDRFYNNFEHYFIIIVKYAKNVQFTSEQVDELLTAPSGQILEPLLIITL